MAVVNKAVVVLPLTGQRPNGGVVDKGENEEERANRPGDAGAGCGSQADETDDHEGNEDAQQTAKVDCPAAEHVDHRPREHRTDKRDGVLR